MGWKRGFFLLLALIAAVFRIESAAALDYGYKPIPPEFAPPGFLFEQDMNRGKPSHYVKPYPEGLRRSKSGTCWKASLSGSASAISATSTTSSQASSRG